MSPGLCANCEHMRVVRSDKGSEFYRCGLSDTDARFPKYPRIPVRECAGWKEKETTEARTDADRGIA